MPRLKRATLTDVAKRAGVSVTTASYILNGRADEMRISAETDHRVQAAMKDLDYRPNWSARTLRRRTTQTIGLVSDNVATGAYASQLLSGASAGARSHEHLLVIGEAMGDPAVEDLLIKELTDREVDGIIYATLAASRITVPERLRKGRTVLLNCVDPDVDLPAIMPDDLGGGRSAVEHLLAAGVEGEVFVVGEDPTPGATAGEQRLAGIVAALQEAGRCLAGVVPCPWGVEPAREAVGARLAQGARPRALICLNDRVAMGVYQALAAHGLSIPHDVSVISFDGSELASWLQPRLTTLALPLRAMGELAARTLMSTEWRVGGVTRLPLTLEPGESVRHGAARRRAVR